LFTLVVMGGATRNLVAHLLQNDPVSARAAYSAVRARFWGLVLASIIVLFWLGIRWGVVVLLLYTALAFIIIGSALLSTVAPIWFCVIIGTIGSLAIIVVLLWVFF